MNLHSELKILQEIDTLSPPKFSLLPDTILYDKDNEIVDCYGEVSKEAVYVSFSNDNSKYPDEIVKRQVEYLKRIFDFKMFNKKVLFNYREVRTFLINTNPKSII